MKRVSPIEIKEGDIIKCDHGIYKLGKNIFFEENYNSKFDVVKVYKGNIISYQDFPIDSTEPFFVLEDEKEIDVIKLIS